LQNQQNLVYGSISAASLKSKMKYLIKTAIIFGALTFIQGSSFAQVDGAAASARLGGGALAYSGCQGKLAFVPVRGSEDDPISSCRATMKDRLCNITAETCCLRQCYYLLTGKVTRMGMSKEGMDPDRIRDEVYKVLGGKLRPMGSNAEGVPSARTQSDEFFDGCIHSCTNVLTKASGKRMLPKADQVVPEPAENGSL
jgi:hypothetical protein